nr:GTP cyclohydrolase I FolE [Klebsiella pneumoniae]
MDEPTSSLTEKEVNHLFKIIRKLKDRGCGIVYISHKMEEIFQLCDEITILRDGQWIATQPLEGLDMDKIIAMMVGRSLNQRFPDRENTPGEVILQVRNLTSLRQPSIRDVSFDLHKGEILGIAGLVGAKRTDIVETLFGIREKASGTITLHGKKINNHSANEAINHGFALVTEERRYEALVARGLETPMRAPVQEIDNETRKRLITGHMTEIMQLLNLDLSDDSLMETPHRIAKMYVDEIFSGLDYSRFPKITVIENKMKVDEMVTVRDITLTSTCEHHFVTIDGKATVAYIPKDSVIGLSKINRIVQFFAQRPQVQERLTQQILIALQTLLGTNNVAVSIDAVHYCVKARGIRDATSATTTTSLGGLFKSSQNTRQEFLRAVRHHN